jgi:hypothetical protein
MGSKAAGKLAGYESERLECLKNLHHEITKLIKHEKRQTSGG